MSNILTANSIQGPVVANAAEATTDITNKVITPGILLSVLKAPTVAIGSLKPSPGVFTNLTADTVNGLCVATSQDLINGSSSSKIITPMILKEALMNPIVVTGGSGGAGIFSNMVITGSLTLSNPVSVKNGGTGLSSFQVGDLLVASGTYTLTRIAMGTSGQFLSVDPGVVGKVSWANVPATTPATSTTSGVMTIATSDETIAGANLIKAVTPATLNASLLSPPIIGSTQPNNAVFKSITINEIKGNALANNIEATAFIASNKAITPSNVPYILASPSPIGSNIASTGVFTTIDATTINTVNLSVVNPPWLKTAVQYTVNSDVVSRFPTNKAVTPSTLRFFIQNPLVIGSETPNGGIFTTVTCDNLNVSNPPWVPLIPLFESIPSALTTSNTIVSPLLLGQTLANPPIIGSTTPNDAYFSHVYGIIGDGSTMQRGYFTTVTASSIAGPVVASAQQAIDGSGEDIVITPGVLPALFASPPVIGSTLASDGYFNNLSFGSVSGSGVASVDEISKRVSSKVVTPSSLRDYLDSPGAIGTHTPSSAFFTELNFQTVTGPVIASNQDVEDGQRNDLLITPLLLKNHLTQPNPIGITQPNTAAFTSVDMNALGGSVQASPQDIVNGTSNTQVISPAALVTYLSMPGPIGTFQPSDAQFVNLTVVNQIITPTMQLDSLTGGVVATLAEVIEGDLLNKVVTPRTFNQALASPPIIGFTTPNDAIFNAITASSIQGGVIATSQDALSGVDTKVITPKTLAEYMQSPGPIGGNHADNANFVNMTATSIYGTLGDSQTVFNAFVDQLTANTISGPVIASSSESLDSTIDNQVITPASLAYVLGSPPEIGSVAPNNGKFLQMTVGSFDSSSTALASVSDIIVGESTTMVTTPKAVSDFLLSPIHIGGTSPNDASFLSMQANVVFSQIGDNNQSLPAFVTDLTASTVNGPVVAIEKDISSMSSTKVITPATLYSALSSPQYDFGNGNTNASFLKATCSQLYGPLGDSSIRNSGWLDNLDCQSVSGSMLATVEDITNAVNTKVVTAATFASYFQSPGTLGSSNPNSATFTLCSANEFQGALGDTANRNDAFVNSIDAVSVTGSVLATYTDVIENINPNKVITPTVLNDVLASPITIGSTTPNNAFFQTVTASEFHGAVGNPQVRSDAYIGSLNVNDISGNIFASIEDIHNGTDKLVTGSSLTGFLQNPNGFSLGDSTMTITASSLNVSSLQGCAATASDVFDGISNTTFVSPMTLNSVLTHPDANMVIGSGSPVALIASSLSANSITGNCMATIQDIKDDSLGLLVTSDVLRTYLSHPIELGDNTTIGNFSKVTSGTLYGDIGDVNVQGQGFFEGLRCETVSGPVMATFNDIVNKTTNKIVSPSLLNDALSVYTMGGESANFSSLRVETFELTNDLVQVSEGGTGYGSFPRGSLLVGSLGGGLDQVSLGAQSQLLTVSSGTVEWKEPPYPSMYVNAGPMLYVSNSGTQFTISHCMCRDSSDTVNISISQSKTLDIRTGALQSGVFGGSASVNGTVVVSADTDLSALFIVGDAIYMTSTGECRKVVAVVSANEMQVNVPFDTPTTSSFMRGGFAPSTHYYIYATSNGVYEMSTRSILSGENIVDLYNCAYAQLPYVITSDGSGNAFQNVSLGKNYVAMIPSSDSYEITSTFSYIDLSIIVPKTAIAVKLMLRAKNNGLANTEVFFRVSENDALLSATGGLASGESFRGSLEVPLDYFRRFNACVTGSGSASIVVLGYYF